MIRKLFVPCLALCLLLVAAAVYGEGLDVNYGKDLPNIDLKGKTYKVLGKGTLKPGESVTFRGVVFEKDAKAILIGLGKGDGADLDMFVVDSKSGDSIGSDVLLDNVPVVRWTTGDADRHVVNVRLSNAGEEPCEYTLAANW